MTFDESGATTAGTPPPEGPSSNDPSSYPYRVHFPHVARSRRYAQALEIARRAPCFQTRERDGEMWHVAAFGEQDIDLMAATHAAVAGLFRVKLGSTASKERQRDMVQVWRRLREDGYLKRYEPSPGGVPVRRPPACHPEEPVAAYRTIRSLIIEMRYDEAIRLYYEHLGEHPYGPLHRELIYLKRLAGVPFLGRDLLLFLPESSRSPLVRENIGQYISCVDRALALLAEQGRESPVQVLLNNALTMKDIETTGRKGEPKYATVIGGQVWGDSKREQERDRMRARRECHDGRLFDRYPDQVRLCNVVEMPLYVPFEYRHRGVWITYSPEWCEENIRARGREIGYLDGYELASRETDGREKGEDFATAKSKSELREDRYFTRGLLYTSREHEVEGTRYYEVKLRREDIEHPKVVANPFLECVEEILREAENLLREEHGLPRIGEGWLREAELYRLVKELYPDAEMHASPEWLRPQHLDVYVPLWKLAIEYHGEQHYAPVDFFGGYDGYVLCKERDRRKAAICTRKGVRLVVWPYHEPLSRDAVAARLKGEVDAGGIGPGPR